MRPSNSSLAGDANPDRVIDFSDLLIIAQNYGGEGATFRQGDFNYDHKVDFDDLLIVAKGYGQSLVVQPSRVGMSGKRKLSSDVQV